MQGKIETFLKRIQMAQSLAMITSMTIFKQKLFKKWKTKTL
ncbi:hypothetical protein WANG_1424 [Lactobacillus kefiranofaciens subsp. kefiranofaciens]|nr:hypothetical protein WANG_1424 [Lactobacillus kefiranofaciens subsp. kefiranofaciens]